MALGSLNAQKKTEETTFKVGGECNMCKKRIENALDVKGVRFAEWNPETETLFVAYKPKKISLDKIHELIAEVGHDTEKVKAKDEVYENIHGCCRYREETEGNNKQQNSEEK